MRLIKLAILSAVFFFLLLSAFTLLIPSHIRISRAIDISGKKSTALPYLQQLSHWPDWNAYARDSSGHFKITLTAVTDSLVTSKWKVGSKEFYSGLALYETREGTLTVQWYFDFHLKWYPWEKIGSIVYDRQMGQVMQESLINLKQLIESNP